MRRILPVIIVGIMCAATASACSVPVFRYALERWQADSYTLVVAHDKDLSEKEREALESIKQYTWDENGHANIYLAEVNVLTETNAAVLKHLPKDHPPFPAMFLFYPRSHGQPKIIWQAGLTKENANLVVESKMRTELSGEILRGRSATWILMESGNDEQDKKAYKTLKSTLEILKEEMELPAGVATASGDITGEPAGSSMPVDPINQLQSSVPLMISFSIIRLSKDNKNEEVLRSMLINLEPDLAEHTDKPQAFPVFGRGRVLEPIIGEGISEENISGMTFYLGGACSCQIKAQNPGTDLLFNIDWDSWLMDSSSIEERDLPPLSGIADVIGTKPMQAEHTEEERKPEQAEELTPRSQLGRNIGIATLLVFIALTVASASLMRKNR